MSAIKYKVNHIPVVYNHLTSMYQVGRRMFHSYRDAKANQWQCNKCDLAFASYKELRAHKNDEHSY